MGEPRDMSAKDPDAVISGHEVDADKREPSKEELGATRVMLDIAYSHVHEDGEGNGRRWLAILMCAVLIVSLFLFRPPASANWIYWSALLGRLVIIVWLIVR
jgi:hypothetical protein